MKNTPGEHTVPQPGHLTPDQYYALGEIWSFLLHLWYSEPVNQPSSPSHASTSPGKARSLTLNRRKSSFGPLSLLTNKSDIDSSVPQQPLVPRATKSYTIGHTHGTATAATFSEGGNTHASDGEFSPTSPQPNSYYYQHHHQRSSSSGSVLQAPASPTRLSQSFRQPSLASSPRASTGLFAGLGISNANGGGNSSTTGGQHGNGLGGSNNRGDTTQPLIGAHSGVRSVTFSGVPPLSPPPMSSNGHSSHQPHHPLNQINQLNHQLNDKTAAAVAALRRSAAKLKGWVPSKKFTFKYSPAAYHDAFWNFVQNEHPDSVVLRFLKARKWNVERAMEMLIMALEWRISNKMDELAVEDEETLDCKYPGFLYLLKRGKVALPGQDLEGLPLLYINPSLDDQNLHLAFRRLSLYTIEHARMRCKPPNDRMSVVVDLTTLSMSDVELNSTKFIIHAVENCYTELLGTGVLYKAPWVFGRIWKVVAPLFEPSNRNRLKFASTRKEVEDAVGPSCLAFMKPGKGPSAHEAAAALQAESSFLHSKDHHRESTSKGKEKEKESKDHKEHKEKDRENSNVGFHFGKDKEDLSEPPTHFEFPYLPPVPGENDLFHQDSDAKHRAITRRKELELTFERLTEVWQGQRELSSANMVIQERDAVGYKLVDAFWAAEPYMRVRTVFHRTGAIRAPEPFFASAAASTTTTVGTSAPSSFSSSPGATSGMMSGQPTMMVPFTSSGPPSFGTFMTHESSSSSSSPIAACQ